jgi:low temperature requirement protein LtrA
MSLTVNPPRLRYVAGSNPARKVTWLELFFDLTFVAAVAQVGDPLREDYSLAGLIRYAVLFVLIWWAWLGNSLFATRFGTDDVLQRGLTLVQMFVVAAMAANATEALGSRSAAGFAAAYAALRIVLVAQYARARQIDSARELTTRYLVGHGIAAALWLASAFVTAPARFVIWTVAFAIDLGTPWIAVRHSAAVPPDGAHLPERFGLFTLILLGESVVAVMHGMQSQEDWSVPAATVAFLGMAITFAIWWWYFDGAAAASEQHLRSPRDAVRFHVWSYLHLPFYLGVAVAGVGIERIVHSGAAEAQHGADGMILGMSVALVMAALTLIGATGPERHVVRRRLPVQLGLAAGAAMVGAGSGHLPPTALVVSLSALCVAQLMVTSQRKALHALAGSFSTVPRSAGKSRYGRQEEPHCPGAQSSSV